MCMRTPVELIGAKTWHLSYYADTMNIRTRHDAILRSLRRSETTTVDALAREVGASRRTVLRDISALREQGFVIHSEPGRGGGLQLDPQSIEATARLAVAEVFALLISVATTRAAGYLPFSGLADAGLAKIEKTLRPEKVRDLRRLLDCLHVGKLSPLQDVSEIGSIDSDLLPAFENAFLARLYLKFCYRDAKGRQSCRAVEPQAMLILPPLWYLVAWDPVREDFRHFRMDRISKPAVIDGGKFRQRHVPFAEDVCPYSSLLH